VSSLTPNRIVTLLGPTVFAPLAGFICLWASEHLPGIDVPHKVAGALSTAGIFIVGAVIAHLKSSKWLDGWQKYEERAALLGSGATPPAGEFHEAAPAAPDGTAAGYVEEFDEELDGYDDDGGGDDVGGDEPGTGQHLLG
jgi:hypothetical protein